MCENEYTWGKGLNVLTNLLSQGLEKSGLFGKGTKCYPITRRQILDWSKLKQSADNNCKFDENIRKFYKQVENTVGKGEIARYEHFLLFPQCFQKAYFPGASKGVIVWEWVKRMILHVTAKKII